MDGPFYFTFSQHLPLYSAFFFTLVSHLPHLCSVKQPGPQEDDYFETIVCHLLGQPVLPTKSYFLPSLLVNRAALWQAEQTWTQ